MTENYIDVLVRMRVPAAYVNSDVGYAASQIKQMLDSAKNGGSYYSALSTQVTITILKSQFTEIVPDATL